LDPPLPIMQPISSLGTVISWVLPTYHQTTS
jgi:hypothetical protein